MATVSLSAAEGEVAACLEENLDPNGFHKDAAQLAATLAKLDARIDELKSQVFDIVRVQKREFVSAYTRAASLRKQVAALADDLSAVARDAEGERNEFEADRLHSDERMRALRHELALSTEVVSVLAEIGNAHASLVALDAQLDAGRYEEAARLLTEAERRLRALRAHVARTEPADAEQPAILRALASELQRRRASLEFSLQTLFEEAVSLDEQALRVRTSVAAPAVDAPSDISLRQVRPRARGTGRRARLRGRARSLAGQGALRPRGAKGFLSSATAMGGFKRPTRLPSSRA
jgi:tetratricopeptide (TPR) repeat protein